MPRPAEIQNTTSALLMADTFCNWIVAAKPGESVCYFKGELAAAIYDGDYQARETARIALEAQAKQIICLTQRRTGPFDFEYLATKLHHQGSISIVPGDPSPENYVVDKRRAHGIP